VIAIVGRPNVGKSTLFNRFAGERRALVEDSPGLTRDRIAKEVEAGGRRVLVVDTAGLDPKAEEGLPAAVQRQARLAVAQADAIVLVVDGRAGLLPGDAEIARELRRARVPIGVAVNKIDVPAHLPWVAEFHALGFERVRAVSAEHGSGAWDLLEELVAELPAAPEAASGPPADGDAAPRVAIVGRPNVGKSSLANRLLGDERMVVADVPGTTRDSIDTRVDTPEGSFVLVDTAGLRRPGKRTQRIERGSAAMTIRALDRAEVAFVVIDAAEGLTDQDARVAQLARERGCALAIVANKWDLVAREGASRGSDFEGGVRARLGSLADVPVVRVSARSGQRVDRLLPLARHLSERARRRIPTAELNRWLEATLAHHDPSMAQRGTQKRPVKLFYATQTGVRPPRFVAFCSDPAAIDARYRRYLENRLREDFDLAGVSVRLQLRARHRTG
jgi:GTP-binding protein